jgi:hypothetical protein
MKQWTERGISGAKLLLGGALLTLCSEPASKAVQGPPLLAVLVSLLFGVVGPILVVLGLYRIGTSHKQVTRKASKDVSNLDT